MEFKNSTFTLESSCGGQKTMRAWHITYKNNRKWLWQLCVTSMLFFSISVLANSIPKETIETLTDTQRELTSPIELHITSADTPFNNATVSLNHEDAWVFFENIKPSTLLASHAAHIFINGAALSGQNGRVAIYGNGSVVMPFGNTYKPLTVYNKENFEGDSAQYSIHVYNKNLGAFDNVIRSFKLKRGYMATLANNSDGSGYSRVFIANNEDLSFEVMPDEFTNSVSFIRVFKHQWVSKKGKSGWDPHFLNGTCYYDWNIGGNSSNDVEYSAIRQNGGWPGWGDINAKQNITHLLGFNEPDRPDQSNMAMQTMIDQWPNFMHSGLRIGSPAWSSEWNSVPGGGNLFTFMELCEELNYRVDFVALHCYWVKSPQQWYNDLKYIYERTGRPLWITEWNNGANWTTESWPAGNREYNDANAQKQLNDMMGILEVLDTASFVERYFIYDWVQDCRAMVLNNQLTKAGEYYAANPSQIAYNEKNDVKPHWNYKEPELAYRYLAFSQSNRLSWTDPNGELTKGYLLEKKAGSGEYTTVYEGTDAAVDFYLDPLDKELTGTITYRLRILTADGSYLSSNEVSYFQTGGKDQVQAGNFDVSGTEWQSALFSEKYESVPLVVLGVPTFSNFVQITQRVNSVSTTSFKLRFEPWLYLNNPDLPKTDQITALALPEGPYNFAGLKAEAQKVTQVDRNWQSVTFSQSFDSAPVIFATVSTIRKAYPVTVAVQNVTATGFELCLKTEEANTDDLVPEDVTILAVEEGTGAINDKRIVVQSNEAGNGIGSLPYSVDLDTSFKELAVFAGLQSAEDAFASTVRYYKSGNNKVTFLKHRETSGGPSSMKKDRFGWMLMDLSPGQTVPNFISGETLEQVQFYPNPVQHTLHLNLQKGLRAEIFDLVGVKRFDQTVTDQLNVSHLPKGMYVLRVKGYQPVSFIKQ